MKTFKENDTVIYTDGEGNRFDTFVIFDTDRKTGLTHINHQNLKVKTDVLEMHPATISGCTMPMHDSFSFEIFKQLKEKFINHDQMKQATPITKYRDLKLVGKLAKAS